MTVDTSATNNNSPNKPNNRSNNSPATTTSAQQQPSSASFQPSSNPNIVKKNRNDVIKTIQEITKFDEFTINEAIEACQDNEGRYSMDQVLNILMDEKYSSENQQNSQDSKNRYQRQTGNTNDEPRGQSAASPNDNPNQNRSNNNKNNDYHANIYGTSNNIDDDDDFDFDNSNSNSAAISSSSSFFSSTSPQSGSYREFNLLREDGKPSGLKNVGNTCWFNSIIQAFFHLPYFRKLILSFNIDQSEIIKLDENSKNVVQFVAELRKLFALMLKSKRKSINPNQTLRFLRSCSKYDVDTFNQEDVSEFATIFVNLIEESFDILYKLQQTAIANPNMKESSQIDSLIDNINELNLRPTDKLMLNQQLNNTRKNRKNPIVNLLNGDILINRKNIDEDVTSSLIEIFREVNIQMCNSRNLHEGLELEWGETSIDKLTTTASSNQSGPANNTTTTTSSSLKSGEDAAKMNKSFYEQESWVVKLPSVLFICLNRYKFVKATQSSSKILEPFEFYPYIYLDRYVYTNRELVKTKRKELKQLNSELKVLEGKLNSIKNYKYNDENSPSSTACYFPLDDVIKCAHHFATTDYSLNDVFNQMTPITRPSENDNQNSENFKDQKEKLEIVTQCLKGWIHQIESKLESLKSEINKIKHKISSIYDEDSLKKIRYNLHSVCIHEGNATSGHFWTYIWNTQQLKWFKFNDTDVSESNWDDLYENGVGGGMIYNKNSNDDINLNQNNNIDNINNKNENVNKSNDRSAYFLVYTKADDTNLYQDNIELDSDLVNFLNEDQESLDNQMISFKLKQMLRDQVELLKKSNSILANTPAQSASNDSNQTCIEHAKAFSDSTYEALSASFERILQTKSSSIKYELCGPEEALKNSIEIELSKYNETIQQISAKLPEIDLRLNHILIYFNANNLPREVKILALYDLFRIQILPESSIKLKILQTLSQLKYNEYLINSTNNLNSPSQQQTPATDQTQTNSNLIKLYEKWQADYRDYRSIIAAFINAVNFLETQRYEEAAQFFCVACEYNERITNQLQFKMKGMDHEFLLACRRKCLKIWNQNTIRKFTFRQTVASQNEQNLANLLNNNANNNQTLSQQELTTLIETMINKFLPCLFRLAGSTNEDKALIEDIRKDWLAVLDSNLPEIQVFQDFMTKLFEDSYANHYHSLNVNKTNLPARFKDATSSILKLRV